MMTLLEICCGSLGAVKEAVAAGADRVELCSGLAEGGMTPSFGLIREAVATGLAVNVLIRPRPGDFHYDRGDVRVMLGDVRMAAGAGASGLVIGALTPEGNLSCRVMDRLMREARSVNPDITFTLHRTFDLCRDPEAALEVAIRHGFDRILTSGCAASAIKGLGLLRRLKALSGGRILIMAAGGVNSRNAALLAEAADELHASARRSLDSTMRWRRKGVPMGLPGEDEYLRKETSREEIRNILKAIGR